MQRSTRRGPRRRPRRRRRPSAKATMRHPGGVPERPKGTGCKPVGSAYGGSNPPAPIVRPFGPGSARRSHDEPDSVATQALLASSSQEWLEPCGVPADSFQRPHHLIAASPSPSPPAPRPSPSPRVRLHPATARTTAPHPGHITGTASVPQLASATSKSALAHLVPLAISILRENALEEGRYYPGDLLAAV